MITIYVHRKASHLISVCNKIYIYQKAIVGLVILLSLCVCVKDGQDAMICYSNDYV